MDKRTIDDAKKKIEKYIAEYNGMIKLWQGVKRERKKDGGDFALLTKSFPAARIVREVYGTTKVKVFGYTAGFGTSWIEDTAYIYGDDVNADAIEKAIAERIELLRGYVEKYEKGLSAIDAACYALSAHVDAINAILTAARETETHFLLRDIVKNNLKF